MRLYADAHADTFYEAALNGFDPARDDSPLHINLTRMRAANQCVQVCSVFTPARYCGSEATGFAHKIIDCIDANTKTNPREFKLGIDCGLRISDSGLGAPQAGGVALQSAIGNPQSAIALIPWLEGASPLAGDLALLDVFYARGVRGIGLTHNHRNEVADGCGCAEPRNGLTRFGRALVELMEDLHVAVDCAHLPQPAFGEVMAQIKRPPCISHTGCRALVPITRNADDDMLRAIAQRDGFIGIDFYPGHVLENAFAQGTRRANCEDIAAHVLHAINVCGIEHVGFGSDFDGFNDTCEDLRHLGDLPNLERALRAKGLNDAALERVFGLNLLEYLERAIAIPAHV
ncbi:MAG: membrane dipeptidase [Planctomycetes bacterium]|nr:membrane dipeptidase [Planctomycetota bacterium]